VQDPKNLAIVTCDVCGRGIKPKDRYIRLQTYTLWSGAVGMGIFVCADCAVARFGILGEALQHPAPVTAES